MSNSQPVPAAPGGIEYHTTPAMCTAFESDSDTTGGKRPFGVLKPKNDDEVLAAVKWANEQRVGLLPVSSTGRRRRGDTVAQRDNVCVLDLSGMKRLVHADGRDKISIVEPGLDFGTVDSLLKPHGLRAFRPLMPRSGKSLITSYLEREPLINPHEHWDVEDPFGGTHLVLGHGRSTPTGTAALEGTLEEHLARGHRQMVAVGPSNLDLLRVVQGSQGTLATMTWAAVYCEKIPTQERAWFCSADSLESVINFTRDILYRRLGNALFIVDRVQLAMMLGTDHASVLSLATQLPAWTAFVSVCAGNQLPDAKMAWQSADVLSCAQTHGATAQDSLAGHSASKLMQNLRTSETLSFRDRPLGAHRELFFIQQLDKAEKFVGIVKDKLSTSQATGGLLGVYIQPMAQGVSCHIEFTWAYSKDANQTRDDETWHQAARQCAQAGAFFSRPYGRWAEIAFDNDKSNPMMMKMTKTILDPNGVMNPGRLPY